MACGSPPRQTSPYGAHTAWHTQAVGVSLSWPRVLPTRSLEAPWRSGPGPLPSSGWELSMEVSTSHREDSLPGAEPRVVSLGREGGECELGILTQGPSLGRV